MQNFELNTTDFKGPLDKLLELIESKKLPISSVSMADTTQEFLEYIKTLSEVNPRILADFIFVASRLILIKSHTLLPQLELTEDEEGDIADLEDRLKAYKELKNAEAHIKNMWGRSNMFTRDGFINIPEGFYFSHTLSSEDILVSLDKLLKELNAVFPKEEKGEEVKMINFEEKLQELADRVVNAMNSSFNTIVSNKDKAEVVVTFLALLHLLKDKVISITQEEKFGDIIINKN